MKKCDYDKKYDQNGCEVMDPTPVAMPLGYHRPPSLQETIVRLMRNQEFMDKIASEGGETFEEANDFDVGDDLDPTIPFEEGSPYQEVEDGQFEAEAELEKKLTAKKANPPSQPPKKATKKVKKKAQEEPAEESPDSDE